MQDTCNPVVPTTKYNSKVVTEEPQNFTCENLARYLECHSSWLPDQLARN